MDSLEEYREQRLAALRQQGDQELQQLRAQLRERMKVSLNEEIAKLQETIRKSNENELARFNRGSTSLEEKQQEGKWPSKLLEAEEAHLKNMLDSTLEGNQKILDALIARIQRDLEQYQG